MSLRDIPATVVDLLGLGGNAPFPGRTLARFWNPDRGTAGPLAEPILMETGVPLLLTNQGREPAAKGPMKSLVAGGMHYIRSGNSLEELFVLKTDPEEQINLTVSETAREDLQRFRSLLAALLKRK